MSVSINGKTIKDMPVTVAVIPSYTSLRLKRTISGSVRGPYGIDFTENGDVFIGGWNDHHVIRFDRNGKKLIVKLEGARRKSSWHYGAHGEHLCVTV